MADAEHSLFSASKAVQWMACPGSLVLAKDAPRKTSRYAAEGTAAHQLAAWCLEGAQDAVAFLGRVIEADGFEFVVDEDMARDVQVYVDQVREYATGADALMVERRVTYADAVGADAGQAFGTSDTIIVKGNLLIVVDLKFGRGEEVEATGNPQMQLYALGAIAEFDGIAEFDRVLMVISQPRVSRAPKEWEISVAELREFAGNAREAVERCFDARQEYPSADWHEKFTKATEKGCRWCPHKAQCVTLREAVTEAVFDSAPATPEEFEAAKPMDKTVASAAKGKGEAWLAAALSKVDMIEEWCKAIRAEAESRMLAGGAVPGFKLVKGKKGNRTWSDKNAVEAMLKTFRLKVEEMYDLSLISPTTAEKLAKAGTIGKRQWPKLQELISQSEGKLHVAPDTDPREAISVTPVDNEFEAVGNPASCVDDLA